MQMIWNKILNLKINKFKTVTLCVFIIKILIFIFLSNKELLKPILKKKKD